MRDGEGHGTALEDALVTRLSLLTPSEPLLDDDVRARQRARLVAMAAVRTPEARPSRVQRLLARRAVDAPPARWRARVTAGLAGAALTVATLSGMVALSQGSDPGDLLYDVKRGTEQTQLALASDSERGLTLLTFATTRLAELESLTGSEAGALPVSPGTGDTPVSVAAGADAATVQDVLGTMDRQTVEGTYWLTGTIVAGGSPAPLDVLDQWTLAQRTGLQSIGATVPAAARTAVATSTALVDSVAARSAALRAGFACTGGLRTSGSDELGPVPAPCADPAVPGTTGAPSSPSPDSTAPGTAAPPTAATTAATPAAPATGGGAVGTGGAPTGSAGATGTGGAAVPVPTAVPTTDAPVVPLPVPAVPVPSSDGAVVEVPPVVPGVQVCLPPLLDVGC